MILFPLCSLCEENREDEMDENSIAEIIVDCAYHIHVKTGPGLFESIYEVILAEHLRLRGAFS